MAEASGNALSVDRVELFQEQNNGCRHTARDATGDVDGAEFTATGQSPVVCDMLLDSGTQPREACCAAQQKRKTPMSNMANETVFLIQSKRLCATLANLAAGEGDYFLPPVVLLLVLVTGHHSGVCTCLCACASVHSY
jgi:hypothetical protein